MPKHKHNSPSHASPEATGSTLNTPRPAKGKRKLDANLTQKKSKYSPFKNTKRRHPLQNDRSPPNVSVIDLSNPGSANHSALAPVSSPALGRDTSPWKKSKKRPKSSKSPRRERNNERPSGSTGAPPPATFKCIHIPITSCSVLANNPERSSPASPVTAPERQHLAREAKLVPSIESPDGIASGSSPAHERDTSYIPTESATLSDVDSTPTPCSNRRKPRKSRRIAGNQAGPTVAAEQTSGHIIHVSKRSSSPVARGFRELTAFYDSVTNHVQSSEASADDDVLFGSSSEFVRAEARSLLRLVKNLKEEFQDALHDFYQAIASGSLNLSASNCKAFINALNAFRGKFPDKDCLDTDSLSASSTAAKQDLQPSQRPAANRASGSGPIEQERGQNWVKQQVAKRPSTPQTPPSVRRPIGNAPLQPSFAIPSDHRGLADHIERDHASNSYSTPSAKRPMPHPNQSRPLSRTSPALDHGRTSPSLSIASSGCGFVYEGCGEGSSKQVEEAMIAHVARIGGLKGGANLAKQAAEGEGIQGSLPAQITKQELPCRQDKGKGKATEYDIGVHTEIRDKSGATPEHNDWVHDPQSSEGRHDQTTHGSGADVRTVRRESSEQTDLPDLSTILQRHRSSSNSQHIRFGENDRSPQDASDIPLSNAAVLESTGGKMIPTREVSALHQIRGRRQHPDGFPSSNTHVARQSAEAASEGGQAVNVDIHTSRPNDPASRQRAREHGSPQTFATAPGSRVLTSPNTIRIAPRKLRVAAASQTQDKKDADWHKSLIHREVNMPHVRPSQRVMAEHPASTSQFPTGSTAEHLEQAGSRSQQHGTIPSHVFYEKDAPRAHSRLPVDMSFRQETVDTDVKSEVAQSPAVSPSLPRPTQGSDWVVIAGPALSIGANGVLRPPHGLPTPYCSSPARGKTPGSSNSRDTGEHEASASTPQDTSPDASGHTPQVKKDKKRKASATQPVLTTASQRKKSKHVHQRASQSSHRSPRKHSGTSAEVIPLSPFSQRRLITFENFGAQPDTGGLLTASRLDQQNVNVRQTAPHDDRQMPDLDDEDPTAPFLPASATSTSPSSAGGSRPNLNQGSKSQPAEHGHATASSSDDDSARPDDTATISATGSTLDHSEQGSVRKRSKRKRTLATESPPPAPSNGELSRQDFTRPEGDSSSQQNYQGSNEPHRRVKPTLAPVGLATNGLNRPRLGPPRWLRLETPATVALRARAQLQTNALFFMSDGAFNGDVAPPRNDVAGNGDRLLTTIDNPDRETVPPSAKRPKLAKHVPHDERKPDEELIRIGWYGAPAVRHNGAPYAFRKDGKVTADYRYLMQRKDVHGNEWSDERKKILTSK